MSRSVNKITLIGNVGRDPDIQETKNGTKVAHFSLATNRRPDAEGNERTDWHRVTVWNKLAQFVEDYLHAGDRIYVDGRVAYDAYERDGVSIPTAEVIANELVLLSARREGGEVEEAA